MVQKMIPKDILPIVRQLSLSKQQYLQKRAEELMQKRMKANIFTMKQREDYSPEVEDRVRKTMYDEKFLTSDKQTKRKLTPTPSYQRRSMARLTIAVNDAKLRSELTKDIPRLPISPKKPRTSRPYAKRTDSPTRKSKYLQEKNSLPGPVHRKTNSKK